MKVFDARDYIKALSYQNVSLAVLFGLLFLLLMLMNYRKHILLYKGISFALWLCLRVILNPYSLIDL